MGQVVGLVLVQTEHDWGVCSDYFDFIISGLRLHIPAAEHDVSFIRDLFGCQFHCFFSNLCVQFFVKGILEQYIVFKVVRDVQVDLLLLFYRWSTSSMASEHLEEYGIWRSIDLLYHSRIATLNISFKWYLLFRKELDGFLRFTWNAFDWLKLYFGSF